MTIRWTENKCEHCNQWFDVIESVAHIVKICDDCDMELNGSYSSSTATKSVASETK